MEDFSAIFTIIALALLECASVSAARLYLADVKKIQSYDAENPLHQDEFVLFMAQLMAAGSVVFAVVIGLILLTLLTCALGKLLN